MFFEKQLFLVHTVLRIVVTVYQIGESLKTGRCGVFAELAVERYFVSVVNESQKHVMVSG